jgi:hypothetical protein
LRLSAKGAFDAEWDTGMDRSSLANIMGILRGMAGGRYKKRRAYKPGVSVFIVYREVRPPSC